MRRRRGACAAELTRLHQGLAWIAVSQDDAGLMGEIGHELVLDRRHALARALADAQRPEGLSAMAHEDGAVGLGEHERLRVGREPHRCGARRIGWPRGGDAEHALAEKPDVGTCRARPLGENAGGHGEDLVDGVALRHTLREMREHLVRGRARSVHDAVSPALEALARRLEADGDDSRRGEGQARVGIAARAGEGADADDDGDIRYRLEPGERAVHRSG